VRVATADSESGLAGRAGAPADVGVAREVVVLEPGMAAAAHIVSVVVEVLVVDDSYLKRWRRHAPTV